MPRVGFHGRPALRAALFTGVALALWTLATPAFAAPAPLCDDRGASAIAPPPMLDTGSGAIQRAPASAACAGRNLPIHATVTPPRHGFSAATASAEPALPIDRVLLDPAPGESLDVPPSADRPHEGVRYRVERPPRG